MTTKQDSKPNPLTQTKAKDGTALLERKVEVPPIEDTLAKANAAIAAAQKAKQKLLKSIMCTDCGHLNVQVRCSCITVERMRACKDHNGDQHIYVCLDEDNIYVNPKTGKPITDTTSLHILNCKRGAKGNHQ